MASKSDPIAVQLIQHFEGFRSRPYKDSKGVPTIGFGSTFYRDATPVTLADPPVDIHQALDLLDYKLSEEFEPALDRYVSVPLNPNQHSALICFIYNAGTGAFEHSTLRKKINQGDFQGAANEFPKWVTSGGKVIKGLVERRAAERALFLKEPV